MVVGLPIKLVALSFQLDYRALYAGRCPVRMRYRFSMLMTGIIIAGIASGAEVPVAITVLSFDAPDAATSSRLISTSQVFWQAGMFGGL